MMRTNKISALETGYFLQGQVNLQIDAEITIAPDQSISTFTLHLLQTDLQYDKNLNYQEHLSFLRKK
jgi:hypothetical protein